MGDICLETSVLQAILQFLWENLALSSKNGPCCFQSKKCWRVSDYISSFNLTGQAGRLLELRSKLRLVSRSEK